ncbi:S8 family peptidase [Betaproteobacteria bacterium LSUCC0117]|nr:S8 family peptidase [Betaproteobacteria bacterium LSUCC0117]
MSKLFNKQFLALGACVFLTANNAAAEKTPPPESAELVLAPNLSRTANSTQISVNDLMAIDFTNSEALIGSTIYVLSAFLTEAQLEELTVSFQTADPDFSENHPQRVIDRFNSLLGTEGFNEKEFKFEFLSKLTLDFGIALARVQTVLAEKGSLEIVESVDHTAKQKASETEFGDLIYALPLLALGAGGGGGGGGSGLNTGQYETSEYSAQYGLGKISASTAYARGYTGAGVTVSVLDSPFDTDHPDLAGKFTTGYNGSDGSTNVACTPGACTSTHGTFVSGIIAAQKNSTGMHGVAYGATIKPVTIFNSSGTYNVTSAQLANAVAAGSGSGIAVMNNSWGSSSITSGVYNGSTVYYRSPTQSALATAVNAAFQTAVATTVVVFANGNDGLNSATGRVPIWNSSANASNGTSTGYIGSVPTTLNVASTEGRQPLVNSNLAGAWLTVAALDSSNVIASYSNGCGDAQAFCISAPGSGIYSTVDLAYSGSGYSPSGGYGTADGTSFAAPHVAGAIALLKQQFPNLTPQQLVTLILSTATDLGATGTDPVYGVGMLNLSAATTPHGTLNLSGLSGLRVGNYTVDTSGISLSNVFTTDPSKVEVGVLDSYDRAYNWLPLSISQSKNAQNLADYVESSEASSTTAEFGELDTRVTFGTTGSGTSKRIGSYEIAFYDGSVVSAFSERVSSNGPITQSSPIDSFASNLGNDLTGVGVLRTAIRLPNRFAAEFASFAGKAGGDYFSEYKVSFQKTGDEFLAGLDVGSYRERNSFLGSKSTGAFELNAPSNTQYLRARLSYDFSERVNSTLSIGKSLTSVSFKHANFISMSPIVGEQATADLAIKDVFGADDRMKFSVMMPFKVRKADMSINTIDGYAPDGSYFSSQKTYDLSSSRVPLTLGIGYAASVGKARYSLDLKVVSGTSNQSVKDKQTLLFALQQVF